MFDIIFYFVFSVSSLVFQNDKPVKVVFFGDSITELGVKKSGYIDVLSDMLIKQKLQNEYQLIGSGISGNKIYDLFFRMEKDVMDQKPDIVVIWIGVNDVWHKSSFGTGTDSNKFESMYVGIIQKLQKEGIKVYCCTPACIGEKTDHSNAQDGDLNEYSKIIRKIASANNAALIDFRASFIDYNIKHNVTNSHKGILTYDGVHLNETGNNFVAELMWKNIFLQK